MADKPEPSAQQKYLDKVTAQNAKQAQQKRIDANSDAKKSGTKVPDLNPADKVVARMQEHAAKMKLQPNLPAPSENTDLRDRVARLENLISLTLYSLNNATITCTGGMVVLTLPDLPPDS